MVRNNMKKFKSEPYITIVTLIVSMFMLFTIGYYYIEMADKITKKPPVKQIYLQESLVESAASYGYYCATVGIAKAKCLYDLESGMKYNVK